MPLFKRGYRKYTGPIVGKRTRFEVLVRYATAEVWSSRLTNVLFVLCMVPALISMAVIYIMNNDAVRLLLSNGHGGAPDIAIDGRFFYVMLQGQCWPALVLTAWIGPRLISGDLANDALPIILSHPISRVEYVLAKLTVLGGFLSAVTWIPSLLLFAFQSYLSVQPWALKNAHIAAGLFAGSLLWIALLSLLGLAVAAWVKWRIVASGLLFAAVFVPAALGTVFNGVMRTNWGNAINIPFTMVTLWRRWLGVDLPAYYTRHELPTLVLLLSTALMCALCVMALNTRIRAREVVRG